MFFAKGEIIMNNIYKVIWSKAKNCYVVASEIARSHTKSATGSKKIGGVTRRSLLASLMALSLLCGGFGVATAADGTVHVEDVASSPTSKEVYTTDKVYTKTETDGQLALKANAIDVAKNTTDIATNKGNIKRLDNDKLSKEVASATYATNEALNDLNTAVTNKVDESVFEEALDGKADTDLRNLTEEGKTAIKTTMADELAKKADAANVYTRTEADEKLGLKANVADMNTELEKKADKTYVNDAITAAEGKIGDNTTAIGKLQAKDAELEGQINAEKAARVAKDNAILGRIGNVADDGNYIKNSLTNNVSKNLKVLDDELAKTNDRTAGIKRDDVSHETTIENNVTVDNLGNVTAEGKLKGEGVDAGTGAITTTGAVNAGSLNVTDASHLKGDVTMDKALKVTGDTSLNNTDVGGKLNVTGASDLKGNVILGTDTANTVTVNGKADFKAAVNMDKGLTVTNGDTSLKKTDVDGALTVTGESSLKNTTVGGTLDVTGATTLKGTLTAKENATFEKNVTVQNDLTVNGKLNVDKISLKNDELKNGKKYDSATTITADEISNLAKVTEQGNTTESQFTHNEKGTFNHARDGNNADWKESNSNVTADGVSNKMTDSDGNRHTYYQTAAETKEQLVNGDKSNFEKKTAKGNTISITEKDADGNLKSSLTNTQTVNGEKTSVTNKDSSSTINQGADQIRYNVTSKDANKTSSSIEVKADGITNTSKDGTITNDAKDIVNNATGDMTNNVGGKLTTTVKELATENFNGGLDTTVTGTENHTVNGKQINTVTEGQENIISGGQTNTITGGQINNITGDQTTTITGNKKETVTENVTEDYKKDLTTTVGGNETHEVKGTKTETVEGKLTENFKGGQETNVTGDQTTNVSGTQTINATDINRNASSGMIDTIDNDYGTNTETKVAGKTTTDVSIKGTGEEGKYIRGANESRDYLIKGTLKNSETKTVEKTSTEITDGNGKTSATIQDKTQISGSVTNGTSSAVSNVKADSIDTAVIEGTNTSLISQKKDSITSAVGNGTTSTVIQQGDKDITIASNGGTVGIVGKDIINNATNEITNTAGTKITDKVGNNTRVIDQTSITDTVGTASRKIEDGKITDTAGDSTVTTENGKGTTFSKTGSTAYREGGPTDTNISGNTITTGKVTMDYAEVMKDLGVHGNAKVDQNLEVGGTSTLKGDVTMESNATVKKDLTVEGNTNLKNTKVDGTLDVTQKANFGDSVSIAKDLSVGGNATIKGDVTAKSYKVGDKTYISAAGINANDQKITNVADGSISEGSKDAVNGGQLYTVKNDLEGKVNKVGANAAAMANLHPMEFDPDSKWNIAAAIGNYGSETAAALGAFYRPNDNVMVNLSTAFGTGENMVGGGVSVRLGKGGNKLSREETNALKAQVADLTARMDALLSVLNPNMSKDFPDVPENHWAYEAVSRLAGNDIVQGYPDGEFHGERTMTRYEMAEIIYNALSRGAEAEKELVEEFKPELQAMAASEKATAERAEG